MNLYGGLNVLSMGEMYDIHLSAMRIIRETGLEILNDELLEIAENSGIRTDRKIKRVYPGEADVLETIRQVSGARTCGISVNGTDRTRLCRKLALKISTTIGSNHGFVFDGENMKLRDVTHSDVRDYIKLRRYLGCEEGGPGLIPQDVPQDVSPIHAAAISAKYSRGSGVPDCKGLIDMEWIGRVMQSSGRWTEGQEYFTYALVRSPLSLVGRDADVVLYGFKKGWLTRIAGVPICGATSPCTLAGDLALRFAENWGFMTFSRLITPLPNNKLRVGGFNSDVPEMDLKLGRLVTASPRLGLLRIAWTQMQGEFYKLPGAAGAGIDLITDAVEPGIQAAVEKCFSAIPTLTRGVYTDNESTVAASAGLGTLASNLCLSMEQSVIDNEIVKYLNKFIEGIVVNEDTMGVDSIIEEGPSGNFMSCDHTLRYFRQEGWFPELFYRGSYDDWMSKGRKNPVNIAREKVIEAMKLELPLMIPEENAGEVDRVVEEAEKAILGRTTGIRP